MKHFAVAVVFPGAGSADIVNAAIKNEVHIIDKEDYKAGKDYNAFSANYHPYLNDKHIDLLFVFREGFSIYANTEDKMKMALERIAVIAGSVV